MSQPTKPDAKAIEAEKAAAIAFAEATIRVIEELVQIMSEEPELISARKNNEHKELLQRKQRLTMDYRANIKTIAAEPEMVKLLPDDVRASLKSSGQKLSEISDRNAKFLRGAVMATQRLIQNIVSIIKQEVLPKTGYTNPTDIQSTLGSYSPLCKPVAVSRTA